MATVSYGVKCLALCTLRNATAKKYVSDNELMTFYKLLKSESEVTIGNSALILGSCFEQSMLISHIFNLSPHLHATVFLTIIILMYVFQ